jgi:hypothetical protein
MEGISRARPASMGGLNALFPLILTPILYYDHNIGRRSRLKQVTLPKSPTQ